LTKVFPSYKQPDNKDCGPPGLRIISKFYGKTKPLKEEEAIKYYGMQELIKK